VVDRGEQPGAEQIGQLASVDPVILVLRLEQSILAWITHQHFGDVRLQQVMQPRRSGSFFKAHMQTTAQSVGKL
jgi:hypothetical protein